MSVNDRDLESWKEGKREDRKEKTKKNRRERGWQATYMALATSPRRKVISISADILPKFEMFPCCLNSGKSFGKSASTSVAAIDAGRPCRTLTRL